MILRFYEPKTIVQKAVAWWTKSRWCHVSVVVNGLEWEATPKYGIHHVLPRKQYGCQFDVGSDMDGEVEKFLLSVRRDKYDFAAILHFVFPFVHEMAHYEICSELAFDCGVIAQRFQDRDWTPSPQDVYALAVSGKFLQQDAVSDKKEPS